VPGWLISFNTNGLPKIAEIRVTTALIIATRTGVSSFFSGFFSRSAGGGVGAAPWGVVPSVESVKLQNQFNEASKNASLFRT
jgi:hypothetical protein